jgi:hypothetical protein
MNLPDQFYAVVRSTQRPVRLFPGEVERGVDLPSGEVQLEMEPQDVGGRDGLAGSGEEGERGSEGGGVDWLGEGLRRSGLGGFLRSGQL